MGLFDDVEPTVLSVFPDVPLAFVWFLSRTILLLMSQHWLEAVPLDPELAPVPCALAIPATAMSIAPVIAARQILFMVFSLLDREECRPNLNSHAHTAFRQILDPRKITRGILQARAAQRRMKKT
jgi:hypothetical protein